MKPNTLFFVEFLFFDVVALAWGAWEFWSVRPGSADRANDDAVVEEASPDPPGHPKR
jgi:hypothetical protein